jgi:hypothetical protein
VRRVGEWLKCLSNVDDGAKKDNAKLCKHGMHLPLQCRLCDGFVQAEEIYANTPLAAWLRRSAAS